MPERIAEVFGVDQATVEALDLEDLSPEAMGDAILAMAVAAYEEKERLLQDPASARARARAEA